MVGICKFSAFLEFEIPQLPSSVARILFFRKLETFSFESWFFILLAHNKTLAFYGKLVGKILCFRPNFTV
jgi:hypothetical protein